MRLTPTGTAGLAKPIRAFCFSTDAVGDCVYIMGDRVGRTYQVTSVDVDDVDIKKAVAVGVVTSKSSPTDCIVQLEGPLENVFFGMTPGAMLFVGHDSRPTESPAPPTFGIKRVLQQIGHAIASDVIWISPGQAFRRQG